MIFGLEWYWVALIAAGVILFFTLFFTNKKFKRVVYKFVLQAEKNFSGSKRGQEKFDWVAMKIYGWLPNWATLFITHAFISSIIETMVTRMERFLEEQSKEREVAIREELSKK